MKMNHFEHTLRILERSAHLDADNAIFFARELEQIKSRSFDVLYPELRARSILPVSNDGGAWTETIKYNQFDKVGAAKIIADMARDFPRVDVKGKEFRKPVKPLGASYGYNFFEVEAAAHTGKSLEQMRSDAARRAILFEENRIALFGDADYDLSGFLTNPDIPSNLVPADGIGATTTWSTKNPDQIIRDFNKTVNDIVSTTNGVEIPNTVLLPVEQFTYLASTPRSSTSDTTILEYLRQNNPFITDISWLFELNAPGFGFTGDIMVAYNRNPNKLVMEVPMDITMFPPQELGLEFLIHVASLTGGTHVYYPKSINIAEGI